MHCLISHLLHQGEKKKKGYLVELNEHILIIFLNQFCFDSTITKGSYQKRKGFPKL